LKEAKKETTFCAEDKWKKTSPAVGFGIFIALNFAEEISVFSYRIISENRGKNYG
jgi:hypothetical protein